MEFPQQFRTFLLQIVSAQRAIDQLRGRLTWHSSSVDPVFNLLCGSHSDCITQHSLAAFLEFHAIKPTKRQFNALFRTLGLDSRGDFYLFAKRNYHSICPDYQGPVNVNTHHRVATFLHLLTVIMDTFTNIDSCRQLTAKTLPAILDYMSRIGSITYKNTGQGHILSYGGLAQRSGIDRTCLREILLDCGLYSKVNFEYTSEYLLGVRNEIKWSELFYEQEFGSYEVFRTLPNFEYCSIAPSFSGWKVAPTILKQDLLKEDVYNLQKRYIPQFLAPVKPETIYVSSSCKCQCNKFNEIQNKQPIPAVIESQNKKIEETPVVQSEMKQMINQIGQLTKLIHLLIPNNKQPIIKSTNQSEKKHDEIQEHQKVDLDLSSSTLGQQQKTRFSTKLSEKQNNKPSSLRKTEQLKYLFDQDEQFSKNTQNTGTKRNNISQLQNSKSNASLNKSNLSASRLSKYGINPSKTTNRFRSLMIR